MLLARFRVAGQSMEPTFHQGDYVLASAVPYWFRKPRVGDVVVVRYRTMLMVKRIARIERGHFFVRGDNPSGAAVCADALLGKVVMHIWGTRTGI